MTITVKEFDILALLITNQRRVFTYEMIVDLVWNEDPAFYSRKTLASHVSNLKRKLKTSLDIPDYIINVYGIGYKFDAAA